MSGTVGASRHDDFAKQCRSIEGLLKASVAENAHALPLPQDGILRLAIQHLCHIHANSLT